MRQVNIREAKTHLSRPVDEAAAGEDIVLAKSGKPLARLVPLSEKPRERLLGVLAGAFTVPDDFDDPLPIDVLKRFEG